MKNIIIGIICLLGSISLQAQNCNDDTHSTNPNDSWLSCQTSANPNAARGNTHWIKYDFGAAYTLTTSKIWNYNVVGQTNRGMKDIVIDYSLDGVNWTQANTFQIPQASGNSNYTGVTGPNFGGVTARYVLITAVSTWGHSCAGLSEIRIDIVPASCPNALTHPNLPTTEAGIADYESTDYIISNAVIVSGAKVDYDATTYILLQPGFEVQSGAVFNAFIDGCNNGVGGVNLRTEENTIKQ